MELEAQAHQHQQALEHANQLTDQRLIAEEKAELLASQALERRLALQTKHEAELVSRVQKLEQEYL